MAEYLNKGNQVVYGAASYYANNADFQVALSNHFELYLKGLGEGATQNLISGKDAFDSASNLASAVIGNGQDAVGGILCLNVVSFKLPDISVDAIELRHGNDSVKVAGAPKVGTGSLTVRDVIGADTEQMLWAWFNLVYDVRNKTMGFAVDYKKEGILYQFAPDGTSTRAWQCTGIWPDSMPSQDFGTDKGDVKTLDVTLNVDNMYLIRDYQEPANAVNYQFGVAP